MSTRALLYTEFLTQVLRVKLSPAQRVLCRVAYDEVQPKDLAPEDRELARVMFGDVDEIPPGARAVVVAVCGARAGKSYIIAALYLLYLALTVSLDSLAPGQVAVALIVAPDMRLAGEVLRYALGACDSVPAISRLVVSRKADKFTIDRGNGKIVRMECLPANGRGAALRGRSLVGAVLDESAFFRDDTYQVNDVELFRAVSPRVLAGGKTVIDSTPFAESGLLFELFRDNHGKPETALAIHAPTLLLRSDPHTASYVERERKLDPDNARREFDAEFMSSGSSAFFNSRAIDLAIDHGLTLPLAAKPGSQVFVAADFGFRSDTWTIVVVHKTLDTYCVAELEERKPEKGAPLVPAVVVAAFARIAKRHGATAILADGHYRETMLEHLSNHGLAFVPAFESAAEKVEAHQKARTLIHDGRVRMPDDFRLLRQLREVVSRPTSGGGVTLSWPRWRKGGHGDLVSALVLALSAFSGHTVEADALPHDDPRRIHAETQEFWSREAEKTKQRHADEHFGESFADAFDREFARVA